MHKIERIGVGWGVGGWAFRVQELCLASQIRENMVTMSGAPMVHAGSLLPSLIIIPVE